jgi:uncharacterized protein
MKTGLGLFGVLYGFLERHRLILFILTVAVVAASLFITKNGTMSEDIGPMLPDGKSSAAADFELLQQAPFSRKAIISLSASQSTDTETLLQAADRLAASMRPPFFLKTIYGPGTTQGSEMTNPLISSLPGIITGADLESFEKSLTGAEIRRRLGEISAQIQSPTGWAMKDLFQTDPLGLRMVAFGKLQALRLVPGVEIENNHFVSPDRKHALIIAEAGPKMTDSGLSRLMLDAFGKAVRETLPPGVTATMISGHQYTVANADTIKKDLVLVLGCSSLAMVVLYALFLRSWRSIFVFLVSTVVIVFGTAAVLLFHRNVSSVTVGFASVLLGITDDFPIYVYLALRRGTDKAESLARISRPLLFSGATLLVVFGVMLFSALPGQRQIGLFSIVCIAGSMALSLVVLPHVIGAARNSPSETQNSSQNPVPLAPRIVVGLWVVALALSAWQSSHLKINGDIRAMNYVPPSIESAERQIDRVWGSFRDMAMIFARGRDLNSALEANDFVLHRLEALSPRPRLVSLAPLLPSPATQQRNRLTWSQFWKGPKGSDILDRLKKESDDLGFSGAAFRPFKDRLFAPAADITLADLERMGLEDITESLLSQNDRGISALTLVSDIPEVMKAFVDQKQPGSRVRLVSPSGFREELSTIIVRDFTSYVVVALVLIVTMLLLLFRHLSRAAYALVPVVTGLVLMTGAMGALGMSFNIFNIVAAILVIGLGVDFGIFMVYRVTEGHDVTTDVSVLLGGLTTVAGIGMLVFARHPALHSMGTTVLLGLAGAVPSALLVIPALHFLVSEKSV